MLTYRKLLEILKDLPDNELDNTATVCLLNVVEAYGISGFNHVSDDDNFSDILDVGHPILYIK